MGNKTTRANVTRKPTPFEIKVYKAILNIPIGEVRTYKWVARKVGSPKAVRAVGQALKKNPYPLILPCHRVIRSDGDLGGYAMGKNNKKIILDLERQIKEFMV